MKKAYNPDPETLRSDPSYKLIKELNFNEVLVFVLKHIKQRGFFQLFYFTVNSVMLGLIILLVVIGLLDHTLSWGKILAESLAGIVSGSILIIPIHELLHGLAYRILGARKIIFGADPAQLIFYVTADRYTVSGKQIHLLTLTPFLLINIITLTISMALFREYLLFTAFFLLFHNMMCIGDFAISGFVSKTGGKIYTFDEPERKVSYFFKKE